MNCQKCEITCNNVIQPDKKFCEVCKCSYLSHYNYDSFDKLSSSIMINLCNINKISLKSIEETCKLAKTFGVLWLPIGIQPSEVDRFLKYFPAHSDTMKVMFLKSELRYIEIQLQIPISDRSREEINFTISNEAISRCESFFSQRKESNIDVGRLDHLDASEGKMCYECSEIISFGEMCVLMSKQFHKDDLVWHPNCFKCIQCKHFLIDYLFCCDNRDDSGPYCLRHFDDRFYPRCGSCDELIFDDKYASVLDGCFHLEHLRCHLCNQLLANTEFLLDSDNCQADKLWKCMKCADHDNDESCIICHEMIPTESNCAVVITNDGNRVHKECFICQICHETLSISDHASYIQEENQFYCLNCHCMKKCAQCLECKELIDTKDKSNVGNGKFIWHRQCLKCLVCNKNFSEGDSYTIIDRNSKISRVSKPDMSNACAICKSCFIREYQDTCELCHRLIEGEGVNYQLRLFHKSCFKCYNCPSELDITKFTTRDERFYCIDCYGQMFCNVCFCCKLPILAVNSESKMINFETRYWHEQCFNCTLCNKQLLEKGFLFDDDRLSCMDCEVK